MSLKRWMVGVLGALFVTITPGIGIAQAADARRLASIVSVAISEYSMAVDQRGHVISSEEYSETMGFLESAHEIAATLHGRHAAIVRASLDTLIGAVQARRPPATLEPYRSRLGSALGSDGEIQLPSAPLDTTAGRQLFVQNCASCHGALGHGDGPLARGLSTTVPAIGDADATPRLTPELAYDVASVGIRGTSMPAFEHSLTSQQRWNVVNYVYRLRGEPMSLPKLAAGTRSGASDAATLILTLLDSARVLSIHGKIPGATDGAFDAYMAFEPLETTVRARDARLVSSLESQFGDFKIAVHAGDARAATSSRNAIAAALPRVVALAEGTGESASTTFWQSFIIILREGFEAMLVVGAVVAFLIKTGNRQRVRSIWVGVGLGVVASLATAIIIKTLFAAIPASSEIVEAVSLLLAVLVLFSVSYWLISKVEAIKWQQFIRKQVSAALARRGGGALILIAFLAVYREGAETALFYQALFSQSSGTGFPIVLGLLGGSAALALIFVLFYRFGIRIPMRPFFATTSLFLYYMAFVFAGDGVRELQEGNVLRMTPLRHAPSIPWLGLYPTVETVALQAVLLALFAFALVKTFLLRTVADA